MRSQVLALILAAGCVPSRTAVFGPVDREIERRVGIGATWGTASSDARVPAAVRSLLDKPLDRDAAVRIALATNRRLQAQFDTLGIAASDVAAATVLAPLEVDIETKLSSDGIDEVELDVTQDILDLIQLPQRRAVARAGLDAARARAVAATVELVASVERAYVDVVAAHQELELRQSVFDAASASADIAERQRAAGNIAEVGLIREQNQREQARIDLGRAQVDVETTREELNEVLGLTGDSTRWTIGNRLADLPIEQPTLDALEKNAITASLDVAALKADAEAAAGRVGIARVRAWLPELGVGVAADRNDDGWSAGPALSLGVPLFNQQQGPRARANAELKRARNEATATAVEVRARARSVRQRVLGAYAEARHLRDVVLPQRQRIVDETLKQYNAMNASTFELLSARRDLVDAGRQYIDALRRFWRASADARALTRGALPSGDADQPRTNARSATTEEH